MIQTEDITFLTTSRKPRFDGIAFPVIAGTGGFFTRSGGTETIMSGLKQLILTTKGERVMLPNFGTNLRKYVFEPHTDELEKRIEKEIIETIDVFEPRVLVRKVEVTFNSTPQDVDRNIILVSVRFVLRDDLLAEKIIDLIV